MFSRVLKRLDRIFVEINMWLLAIAIGLATLDATLFMKLQLPSVMAIRAQSASVTGSDNPPSTAGMSTTMWIN